jgi:Uma2 family endonuclease
MEVVTTLPRGRAFTRHDLDAMPDDGNRYELVDGALIVTPSPSRRHQGVSARLHAALTSACPEHLRVLSAPLDFVIADDTTLQPDLVVVDAAVVRDERAPLRPHLVVEILSPNTRLLDLHVKRERYASAGVPSYWIVDPDLDDAEPSIVLLDLVDGQYVESAAAVGEAEVTSAAPVSLTLTPAALVT